MIQQQDPPLTRALYEQSQSKTLLFTASRSENLLQHNGGYSVFSGLYQCTLEPDNNFDDFNESDESREICHAAAKLANKHDFTRTGDLRLRSLQFDLSSLRLASNETANSNTNEEANKKKNYIYATNHADTVRDNHDYERMDWELVRAELPQKGDFDSDVLKANGSLSFKSVFRSRADIDDWNECDFDCCTQDDKIYDRWDDSISDEFKQAYIRTFIRSYAVDEHTGHVFLSWEGFYKDCGDVFGTNKKLTWTIGVSRLKMENPSCTFLDKSDNSYISPDHFPRCTEPVSIVYQSTMGRDVTMPNGGFAVIPASSFGKSQGNNGKRSFLLTVNTKSGKISSRNPVFSRVWAFPEGSNGFIDESKRQEITDKQVDVLRFDQNEWEGGSLRLHYNRTTGKPDHLCRTIFESGIECLPILVTVRDGNPVVESTDEAQIFLSHEQAVKFCALSSFENYDSLNYQRRSTTMVSGLDVQWNEISGQPERIFFGCYGEFDGYGNFGSVEKDGNNLMRVLNGAHASSVLFLPQELEGTIDPRDTPPTPPTDHPRPCVIEAQERVASQQGTSFGVADNGSISKSLVVGLTLLICSLCLAIYKRRSLRSTRSTSLLSNGIRSQHHYVELQNLDCVSPEMLQSPSSPPPMEEEVNIVLSC